MADMVQVRRPSVNQFAREAEVRIGRSQFNRSHGRKMTFDASYLYPILIDEVLPGDTFTCRLNGLCRIFSPLDAPMMDNIELESFFFFVPTRLVWSNWVFFMGEHDAAGAQDTDYVVPVLSTGLTVDHANVKTAAGLAASFGIPHGTQSAQVDINALPFRAYHLVYNQWFRDQNVEGRVYQVTGDGPDTYSSYALRQSYKRHDYFTSCLPYLQKGDAVEIPLGGTAQVSVPAGSTDIDIWNDALSTGQKLTIPTTYLQASGAAGGSNYLFVDLADTAGGLTINALRESVAIQRLLEKDARYGTRYVELIKAHFGVTSPDYRLQRTEYLGGGSSYVNVSPVANTSGTATEDQGELRGIGAGVVRGHGWAKSFTEHGYVIGLMRARGDITYFQGLDKLWSRSTRYDFYLPVLANLGEQSVLNKELFVSNSSATDDAVFGYQERWMEYRWKKSDIVGNLNPDVTSSLSYWHLAEDFASLPSLNSTFLKDQTPMSRVVTVTTEPHFILDLWFDYKCARPIPVHSIPSLTSGRF